MIIRAHLWEPNGEITDGLDDDSLRSNIGHANAERRYLTEGAHMMPW